VRVASLHFYPVKGARAVNPDGVRVAPRGLDGDRRWLVVDRTGMFHTQRSRAGLATIIAEPIAGGGLRLSAPGVADLTVQVPSGAGRLDVTVWDSTVSAAVADASAHAWVSAVLGDDVLLVHMDERAERLKRGIWTAEPLPVTFADAYPVLIATTGSLAALNAEIVQRGGAAVPMARFRPNIVIDCDEPWREDYWKVLRIGGIEVDLVKPCDRCVVTTKDQLTGESMGKEPLASLARLRMSGDPRVKGVLFGWNVVPRALGRVEIGDKVEVLTARPEGFPLARM
jgi:uncharacterized protein YcbX